MNKHIATMREALKKYHASALKAQEEIAQNQRYFKDEIAREKNAEVKERLERAKAEAVNAIRQAQADGRSEAESWGQLDGGKITEDAKLLDYGITPEQFSSLVSKYKGNGTMTSLLRKYAEKENRVKDGPHFPIADIPTVEEKKSAYDAFANSALYCVGRISSVDNCFGGPNSAMIKTAVDSFGETTGFNDSAIRAIE